MVSSDLSTEIDAMLSDIFSVNIELSFAGLSLLIIGDYFQVPKREIRIIKIY